MATFANNSQNNQNTQNNSVHWFEFDYDYDLICASFAFVYGIRLRKLDYGDLSYTEFTLLLKYLPGDCQLAQVINIRMAEGEEYNKLPSSQKQMCDEWRHRLYEQQEEKDKPMNDIFALQKAFKLAYGKKDEKR